MCPWLYFEGRIVSKRNFAGSHFAAYPNFDVLYFLWAPVSFPVAAFWWNPAIKLEHSLCHIYISSSLGGEILQGFWTMCKFNVIIIVILTGADLLSSCCTIHRSCSIVRRRRVYSEQCRLQQQPRRMVDI